MKPDAARLAAFEVLAVVRTDDAYANLALPAALARHGLQGRDAAFATELVSGTLRRRGTYDAVLARVLDRPLPKVQAKVLDVLRLGTHQVLGMRVPPHAAISTSVDLARDVANQGAAGFVNAVLRKVADRTVEEWIALCAPRGCSEHRWVEVTHSHPGWVADELRLAVRLDDYDALLRANNEAPAVTLVARPGLATRDELPGIPTAFSPYGVVLDGGNPAAIAAVRDGRAGVQDEGSQLVALALAAAEVPAGDASEVWVDLCAGPGGKAALLAAIAAQQRARFLAVERQPHRAGLVRRALHLLPKAGVVAADGVRPPLAPGSATRVLVDVPCSGLGALRRRPEARWRRQPSDIDELVPLQKALLRSALDLTRPGGVVLYATCSPALAETAGVVEAVLRERDDVELGDAAALLPQVPDCAGPTPGTVQLWPHRHQTDAMFMALLRRR